MIGTGAISFVGAASQWVIMVVLGLPLAFPVFVLSFFLGFIPYIGGFISTGIAFLIAVAVGDPDRRADHGHLDDRLQPRGRQHRQPARVRPDGPHPPGHRARGHPGRIGHRGTLGMFVVVPALGIVAATWRTVVSLMSDSRARGLRGQASRTRSR